MRPLLPCRPRGSLAQTAAIRVKQPRSSRGQRVARRSLPEHNQPRDHARDTRAEAKASLGPRVAAHLPFAKLWTVSARGPVSNRAALGRGALVAETQLRGRHSLFHSPEREAPVGTGVCGRACKSSKLAGPGSPRLGRFDSFAASCRCRSRRASHRPGRRPLRRPCLAGFVCATGRSSGAGKARRVRRGPGRAGHREQCSRRWRSISPESREPGRGGSPSPALAAGRLL